MAVQPLSETQLQDLKNAMFEFYENNDDSKLSILFELFDRNSDGCIQSEELQTVMSQTAEERVSDEDIKEMIKEADTNGDGVIQLAEFVEIMKKHRS